MAKAEKGGASPIEPLKNLILEANQAEKWVFNNDWLKMKSFLQNIGLNPVFLLSDANRFLQKTLDFIGRNHGRRATRNVRFRTKFNMVEAAGVEPASQVDQPAATTCLVRREFSSVR